MPRVNFTTIDEGGSFPPIPDGTYLCEVFEIETGKTSSSGHEMWKIQWKLVEPPYDGRRIFDNMVFGGGALGKVKIMCSRLGLDVSKDIDLTPEMLYKRRCYVKTFQEEY